LTAAYRLSVRLVRRGTLAWAATLWLSVLSVAAGYKTAYPTPVERRLLAASIGDNPAFRALYGRAIAIDTPAGFLQWRYGGVVAVLASLWGLLGTTRLLRGDEEANRVEVVATGAFRPTALVALQLAAMVSGFGLIAAAVAIGAAMTGVPTGGSVLFSVGTAATGIVFAMLGAVAAQLAVTRRQAASWTGMALAAAYAARAASGAAPGLAWLGWTTPLGWNERLHPLTGAAPGVLALLAAVAATLAALAVALRGQRDLGASVVQLGDRVPPSTRLLRSPIAFAVRTSRGVALAWLVSMAGIVFLLGLLTKDVVEFARKDVGTNTFTTRLADVRIDSADGFLGLAFAFLVVVLAVLATTLVGALRDEEATGRLDNLLTAPLTRARWLSARLAAAGVVVLVVALGSSLAAWAGAAARGTDISATAVAGATANCLPVVLFFGAVALTVFAVAPRFTTSIPIGATIGLYLLNFVGALARAPAWVLDLSPFHHVAPVPATAANVGAAFVLTAMGAVGIVVAVALFARRDLEPD
jgi:ABC-2 type transport system permease protein